MPHPQANVPRSSLTAPTAWRRNFHFVVPHGASLPAICVKCGAPGTYYPFKFTHVIRIFHVIVVTYKSVRLLVPLCNAHYERTETLRKAAVTALIAAIPAGLLVNAIPDPDGPPWGVFLGVCLALFGIAVLLVVRAPLTTVYIDESETTLDGACEEFLQTLPSKPA